MWVIKIHPKTFKIPFKNLILILKEHTRFEEGDNNEETNGGERKGGK
jgi:hypothetical protein